MKPSHLYRIRTLFTVLLLFGSPLRAESRVAFRGGLFVYVCCREKLPVDALRRDGGIVAHVLERDARAVAEIRKGIRRRGLTGTVSAVRWDGKTLPYADNLVTCLRAGDGNDVPMGEIMRVLRPGGIAHVPEKITHKPRPKNIDTWTHFLHGPDNNPVADDDAVAPPKRMQWVAGPRWTRSHEITPSVMGCVSAGGRLFYVHDRGPIGLYDRKLPATWTLVARDAFNGVLLWERDLPGWHDPNVYWLNFSVDPNRRLVADGDYVIAALGKGRPTIACDAHTGKTVREYPRLTSATDLVVHGDLIIAAMSPGGVAAVAAQTGEQLWRIENTALPLTLAASNGAVYFCDGKKKQAIRVDRMTGKHRWSAPLAIPGGRRARGGMLVVHDGVVLIGMDGGKLTALSAKDGNPLWTREKKLRGAFRTPAEFCVADGLVWPSGSGVGYDLETGEQKRKIRTGVTGGHHHRCHLKKATNNYLLNSKRGVEFFHLRDEQPPQAHDWGRGTCRLGVVPCNGLLYLPPNSCFCYRGAQLDGFHALAPAGGAAIEDEYAFEKGPAFDAPLAGGPAGGDWPAYRRDNARSGATDIAVESDVQPVWQTPLEGKLSPPVAAGNAVFVSVIDRHRIVALDTADGARRWEFQAGGRIDSPPTWHRGRLVFGCRDGRLYCLRAADGRLAWRRRAAPADRNIVARNQVESTWPLHGSVLVRDGLAYVAAGRSSFLDGGIRLLAVDVATGAIKHRAVLHDEVIIPGPQSGSRSMDMLQGAVTDIMVADGENIYLGRLPLGADLAPRPVAPKTRLGMRPMPLHLIATSGFLDDTYFNRTFWMYARRWPGYALSTQGPRSGQLLVFDEQMTYSVKVFDRRRPKHQKKGLYRSGFFRPGSGYLLLAEDNAGKPRLTAKVPGAEGGRPDHVREKEPVWRTRLPVRIRAMVKAGPTLFVAGPPDAPCGPDLLDALAGRKGATLAAVAAGDGKKRAALALDAPPVFDGLIAAGGRLYLCDTAGAVHCLGAGAALVR